MNEGIKNSRGLKNIVDLGDAFDLFHAKHACISYGTQPSC